MKAFYFLAVLLLMALPGCASKVPGGPSTTQSAALVTCGAEIAAVNILADLRHAGKLDASTIAAVDKDIALVDPVCSNTDPNTLLTDAAAVAAHELIIIAGGR